MGEISRTLNNFMSECGSPRSVVAAFVGLNDSHLTGWVSGTNPRSDILAQFAERLYLSVEFCCGIKGAMMFARSRRSC